MVDDRADRGEEGEHEENEQAEREHRHRELAAAPQPALEQPQQRPGRDHDHRAPDQRGEKGLHHPEGAGDQQAEEEDGEDVARQVVRRGLHVGLPGCPR